MEISIRNGNVLNLESGKEYWFGDPCCVFGDEENGFWDRYCDMMSSDKSVEDVGIVTYKEHDFLYMSTAYGDGSYSVETEDIFEYVRVDSGLLAVIPMDLIKSLENVSESSLQLGVVFTPHPNVLNVYANVGERNGWNRNGFYWSGAVRCVTDGSDEIEDDEYEYEYDYDEDEPVED